MRRVLHNLDLSDEQYGALKEMREEVLTLRDVIAVSVYHFLHYNVIQILLSI